MYMYRSIIKPKFQNLIVWIFFYEIAACFFKLLKLRFSEDLRVQETRRLLQSARPVRIALVQRPEVTWVYKQHLTLQNLSTHELKIQ